MYGSLAAPDPVVRRKVALDAGRQRSKYTGRVVEGDLLTAGERVRGAILPVVPGLCVRIESDVVEALRGHWIRRRVDCPEGHDGHVGRVFETHQCARRRVLQFGERARMRAGEARVAG